MAVGQNKRIIDHLRRAVLAGEAAGLSDEQLLTCFITHRDEAAFEALVRRHGPMVFSVCRRVLGTHVDAEDAFQATFLVLVRKAASIQSRATVANWLYGVAYHTALKARAIDARRAARERQVTEMPEPEAARQESLWRDLQPLLDQELSRLPEKYRLPIVLCDLEGKSRKDAARQLRLPEGTLSSRLTRARAKLAGRLTRRGLGLPGAAVGTLLMQDTASACVPAPLISSTVKCAMVFVTGPTAAGGALSAPVAALTEGVLKAMLLKKLKLAILGVVTAGFVSAGAAVSMQVPLTPKQKTNGVEKRVPPAREVGSPVVPIIRPIKLQTLNPTAKESKVRALQKQRLDLLRKRAKWFHEQCQKGVVAPDYVWKADIRVYKAELELCETDKERIAVQEKIVGVFKDIENHHRQQYQKGVVGQEVLDDAVVNRLEAEIELERLKEKVNPPSK
ncbi:MAG TPA: sigma-70 family RNA polymerase sigma factor [Gemmataceae bacterium]|jgi:RNA polymerase sigma factor (sigma-70 family)